MKKILATVLVTILIASTFIVPALAVDLVNQSISTEAGTCAVAPVIDGKLDADSYQKINFTAGDFSYSGDDLAYLQTLPLEAYYSWDANNFYVFLSGDASKYYYCDHPADDAANIWNQSCIQISLAGPDNTGTDRLEFGLARNSTSGEVLSNVWAQASDAGVAKDALTIEVGKNAQVLLDGGKLSYEVAVPWTTFLMAAPKAGDKIGFNFIYGWSDQGTRMYVEYSAGCAASKDASLFSKVTLGSTVLQAAPATTAAPETQAPAAADTQAPAADAAAPAPAAPSSSAPATGDNTFIILGIMAIAAAGVVVFRKRLFVK